MTYPFAADMAQTGVHFALQPYTAFRWFQVMGERASGTNLIRKIIGLNARLLRTEGLGWKHGFPAMACIPSTVVVVVAVRHAEAWALSMHKRPWHLAAPAQAAGFSDFIRQPWEGVVDRLGDFETLHPELRHAATGRPLQFDRHPITGRAFDNLFALRRAKLAALMGLVERGASVVLVQMETVVQEPEAFMQVFRQATKTSPKRDDFRRPKRKLGHNFSRQVLAPDTPKAMSAADRAFMKAELDLDLEGALGYRYD